MRARNIKPGFFKNEELAECSFHARLLFAGLWCMADREGRIEKRPLRIKAEIFPYDNIDINGELTVIERRGFVKTYVVDGKEYLQVINFLEHQRPHHTEAASKLPEMTEENILTVNSPLYNGEYPPDSLIHRFTDSLIPEEKILSVSQAKADPIPYDSIIESANQILGKKFRATEKHKSIIRARWNEGFREDDFAKVCSTMQVVWGSDQKMQAYLRPETLFGTKMDGYLNTIPVESRELSRSDQWRKETAAEVDAFVYGGRNDQDNGQHTGQAAIC